jgi:predicted transcriptional regulator
MLYILEARGHIKRYRKGREYVYQPAAPKEQAADQAMERVLKVFFGGSFEKAVVAHLAEHGGDMSAEEFKRLSSVIRKAKDQGKQS